MNTENDPLFLDQIPQIWNLILIGRYLKDFALIVSEMFPGYFLIPVYIDPNFVRILYIKK